MEYYRPGVFKLSLANANACFSTCTANGFEVETHLLQDAYGYALSQLDQAQQQVLGADVVVVEAIGFLAGQGQHLLRAGREIVHWFHRRCSYNRLADDVTEVR